MELQSCFIVFCAALYVGASAPGPTVSKESANPSVNEILEKGLQFLVAKLETMERMFLETRLELHEHRVDLARMQSLQEKTFGDLLVSLQRVENRLDLLDHDVGRNLSVLEERSWQILGHQQTACAGHNEFREKLFDFLPKQNRSTHQPEQERALPVHNSTTKTPEPNSLTSKEAMVTSTPSTIPTSTEAASFSSCKDVTSKVSGIYQIRLKGIDAPIKVFCEQSAFGGGWIVIQHRYDGSLDFYRGWNEFRDGFGDLEKEFWWGLEKVHQITKARTHELVIQMKDFDGNLLYAQYEEFVIGSESEAYVLGGLYNFNGNAGDSMVHSEEKMFTTKDRDNDDHPFEQCAHYQGGAWWHGSCTEANLNGPYIDAVDKKSMFWWTYRKNTNGLSYTRMMIRELG